MEWSDKIFTVIKMKIYQRETPPVNTNSEIVKTLDVWIGRGREWAEIMKEIVDSDFTAETGIELNLNVVPSGGLSSSGTANLLLLSITAGTQPDLAMGVSTDMPVEYAIRGVVSDLSKMDKYQEVVSRFPNQLMIPFEYKGGVYGLPETIGFRGLFYRTDIVEELGLDIPNSWEEIFARLLPALNEWYAILSAQLVGLFHFEQRGQLLPVRQSKQCAVCPGYA